MKYFLLFLTTIVIIQARKLPKIEIFEVVQKSDDIQLRPLNLGNKPKVKKVKVVKNPMYELTKQLIKYLNQNYYVDNETENVSEVYEPVFVDKTREGVRPKEFVLHVVPQYAAKQPNRVIPKKKLPMLFKNRDDGETRQFVIDLNSTK